MWEERRGGAWLKGKQRSIGRETKKRRWWSSCKHPEYQRKGFDWINEKEKGGGVVNQQTLGMNFSSKAIKGMHGHSIGNSLTHAQH
jgi:hypothetical protein